MATRTVILVIMLILAGPATIVSSQQNPQSLPSPTPIDNLSPRFTGSASCAAMGCHNANQPKVFPGSEYTTWATLDPHSRAYSVLGNEASARMVRMFRRDSKANAQTDDLCLSCHAPAGRSEQALRSDGVGCEACHGPAAGYRTTHYIHPPGQRDPGLAPTRDLSYRIAMCADCHVGTPGQEVNHDLIASGHPRLFFEYSTYHNLLPRHWREPDAGPSFDARAWVIGQWVTALSSMTLLESRTKIANSWPELAEYNCYACHHSLDGQGGHAIAGPGQRPLGGLVYGTWTFATMPELASHANLLYPSLRPTEFSIDKLHDLMVKPGADAAQVAVAARTLASKMKTQLEAICATQINLQPIAPDDPAKLVELLIHSGVKVNDWESATKHFLAIQALSKRSNPGLNSVRSALAFPPPKNGRRFDGPAPFRRDEFIKVLVDVNYTPQARRQP